MKKELKNLHHVITKCRKCRLYKTACKAVPGEGPDNAKIILVGQNPGRSEDIAGKPFVGLSGTFLTRVLKDAGIERKKLFITSVVKHKTPRNRFPEKDEITACAPYLYRQIEIIKPDFVVLMGKLAWQIAHYDKIKYLQTFHPQAALRFPEIRKKFIKDIAALKEFYGV